MGTATHGAIDGARIETSVLQSTLDLADESTLHVGLAKDGTPFHGTIFDQLALGHFVVLSRDIDLLFGRRGHELLDLNRLVLSRDGGTLDGFFLNQDPLANSHVLSWDFLLFRGCRSLKRLFTDDLVGCGNLDETHDFTGAAIDAGNGVLTLFPDGVSRAINDFVFDPLVLRGNRYQLADERV